MSNIEILSTSDLKNGEMDGFPNAVVYEQKSHNDVVDVMKCITFLFSSICSYIAPSTKPSVYT